MFAAGDAVTGTVSVIEAIAAGRKAASAMDKYLEGDGIIDEKLVPLVEPSAWIGRQDGFAYQSRCELLCEAADQRIGNFDEVELAPEVLQETVDEYNRACEKGFDEIFEKDRKYMQPIKKSKFYACRFFSGAYGTLGGVKINFKTEVLTSDFTVSPGLYAVGLDSCAIYGDSYPFILPGNTMGFALNSGRIAGENAATYAAE